MANTAELIQQGQSVTVRGSFHLPCIVAMAAVSPAGIAQKPPGYGPAAAGYNAPEWDSGHGTNPQKSLSLGNKR